MNGPSLRCTTLFSPSCIGTLALGLERRRRRSAARPKRSTAFRQRQSASRVNASMALDQHCLGDVQEQILIIGSQVRALVRPPSSLCKPHVSGTALNRAFLRGFPATHFSDFGLCRRSRILAAIFGALSLRPKIPFPAAGIEPEVRPQIANRNSDFWGTAVWDFGLAPKLFRIKSERLELPPPFSRRVAEPLDTNAAG
jgi:hypothetical protein